jgi:hypothetical protein
MEVKDKNLNTSNEKTLHFWGERNFSLMKMTAAFCSVFPKNDFFTGRILSEKLSRTVPF